MKNTVLAAVAIVVLTLGIGFALPAVSYAQDGGGPGATGSVSGGGTGATEPVGPQSSIDTEQDVLDVLQRITNWMFTIFIALAAMMIIYAAYIYLTSGGGEEVGKAHKMLLYSVVAIVVATMSRAIVRLVENFVK